MKVFDKILEIIHKIRKSIQATDQNINSPTSFYQNVFINILNKKKEKEERKEVKHAAESFIRRNSIIFGKRNVKEISKLNAHNIGNHLLKKLSYFDNLIKKSS